MRSRAAAIIFGGVLLGALAAVGAWHYDVSGRTVLTDGGSIRQPAASAPVREVLWTPAMPLPVNTDGDDYEPHLTADGQTLYFVRGRAGDNADLYTSRHTAEGWSPPELTCLHSLSQAE